MAQAARRGAFVDHSLDRDLQRLELLADVAQLAQGDRLGRLSCSASSSASTSAISGPRKRWAIAPVSRATKEMPTITIDDGDDLAAGRRRVDVRAERGHRGHRPVDPVPGGEVLAVLLEADEEGAAGDRGQHREQRRVVQAAQREGLARELGEAQQAQQAQQAQDPQALQAGRQHRRGEDDDDQVERVVPEPGPPFRHDGQHHHQLGEEGEPDDPVERAGDVQQPAAGVGLVDRHRRESSAPPRSASAC